MNTRMSKMSGTMLKSLSSLEPEIVVDLWEVDLREIGGELYRFCNQVNERGEAVVWQGNPYLPYPIQAEGFEMTNQGAGNRPKVTVANLMGFLTAAAEQHNQLVGAKVIRRQTLARFLDAVNFTAGNAGADNTQEVVSKFLIERLASLTVEAATLELAAPSEADGSIIPARTMLANTCCWGYRSPECGYTGKPVADKFDMPTSDALQDDCSRGLLGCKARFGATAVLPFGGWPASDKVLR